MSDDALIKAELLMQAAVALADLAREYRNNPDMFAGDPIIPSSVLGSDRVLKLELLCPLKTEPVTIIRMEVPTKDVHQRAVIRVRHVEHHGGLRTIVVTPEHPTPQGRVVGEPICFGRKPE